MENKTILDVYNEFLRAICGYDLNFYKNTGTIIKIENGELCFYEDISYHGSPSYQKTNSKPLTPDEASILETMLAMQDKVKKVSLEKQLKELDQKKSFIERQMKELEEMKRNIK